MYDVPFFAHEPVALGKAYQTARAGGVAPPALFRFARRRVSPAGGAGPPAAPDLFLSHPGHPAPRAWLRALYSFPSGAGRGAGGRSGADARPPLSTPPTA